MTMLEALKNYQQADEDGSMVLVSRQALDEAIRILGHAQGAGNSGETAQPITGPMRFDLMLEKVDAENAQNGEAFNDMRAHIWAAGASHEDADFITRMLTRKGLYLFQAEPWKRCPSTHCERRGECASPRDCTVARHSPSLPSTKPLPAARGCECGFTADACATNHCHRKQIASAGLSPVPAGYSKLPAGVVCKCFKMWRATDGSHWCCLPSTVSSTDKSGAA